MARKDRKSRKASAKSGPPKSKYAAVSKTEVFAGVNYFNRAGKYLVLVTSIEEGENHNGVPYIDANLTILKVMPGGQPGYDYDKRKNGEATEIPSHVVDEEVVDKMMSNNQAFGSNVKRLAMAVGNLTQDNFDREEYEGEIIEEMVSEDQPCAGRVMEIRALQVIKKDSRSKEDSDLTNKDAYTRIDYVELLEGKDITEELDAEIIEKHSIDTDEPEEEDEAGDSDE